MFALHSASRPLVCARLMQVQEAHPCHAQSINCASSNLAGSHVGVHEYIYIDHACLQMSLAV